MNKIFYLLAFLLMHTTWHTLQAQNETPPTRTGKHSNSISYSTGISRMHIYYESDSLSSLWKDNYWLHIVEYDRNLFSFLDAGAFMLYSTKDFDLFRVNVATIGLDVRFHPIGLFYKQPTMIDVYGIVRGGVAYQFLSNLSEEILSQFNQQGVKPSVVNKWHGYFSPGFGIILFNKKRINVLFEYNKDKGFKNTYKIGMTYRY